MTPDFKNRDPSAAEFWNERFEQAFPPWDLGGTPRELQAFVARAAALRHLDSGLRQRA